MTGTPVAPEFETWSAPESVFRIEYSRAVLDEIRMEAVDGYHRVPHGGVETGGILFGIRLADGVRILAWRPIECEYARGPSFILSEKDEAALATALATFHESGELAGMQPVGWYRAHTRSEILLADSDVSFYDRFFPQPWQVGLIVRPASFAPTRAGFFFREPDGSMRRENSYCEFVLTPMISEKPAPEERAAPQVEEAVPAALPISEIEPPQPPVAASPLRVQEPWPRAKSARRERPWKWYAAGALAALAVLAAGIWLLTSYNQKLWLSATDASGQLQIAWNGDSRLLRPATAGVIEIQDRGAHREVQLSPLELRSGRIFYARQSGEVTVRLTVELPGKPPVSLMTRFLKPDEVKSTAAAPVEHVTPAGAASKPEPPKQELPKQEPPKPEPVQVAAKQPVAQNIGPLPAPPPAPSRQVAKFRPPDQTKRPTTTAAIPLAPPKIDSSIAPAPSGALNSVLNAVAPPIAPNVAPPRPAGPSSGRIMWTGRLPKNGRLVLEAGKVSAGAVNSPLPAGPARVSAYPGDLTPEGIKIFTSDPRYSKPKVEPANAQNGWNAMTYTLDPKRASGVRVVEQPSAQNGYKLVLQGDPGKLSVLMLEWRATQ